MDTVHKLRGHHVRIIPLGGKVMNTNRLFDYTRSWAGLLLTACLLVSGCEGDDGAAGAAGAAGPAGADGADGISCWDLNQNGIGDLPDEDTNGDGVVDVLDCQPAPPQGVGNTIAGHVLQAAHGSRAGLKAQGSYSAGVWTVILSRPQTTNTPTQDVQFDLSNAANLYGFSAAIFNNAGGNPTTMLPQDTTGYTLGNETSGADLQAQPVASEPTVAGDFTGPVLTTSPNTPADAAPVALQAAYDAKNVYILGVWTDLTGDESLAKDQWEFDGTSWSRPAGRNEDRIALMFDISTTDWGTGGTGCAIYCHVGETPGDGGRMRTNNAGETLDMWHWKAARSNPMGFADDKHVIWADAVDTTTGTRKGDDGSSVDSNNRDAAGTLPAFMAENDPGANATFLINIPQGSARAVPFDPSAAHQAGDTIAGHVLQAAHSSRAGLKAQGSYSAGVWTVILSRPQTTNTPTQDVQFDLSNAANLYGFSAAIFNNAGGNPTTMLPQDTTGYTLGNETSGADLQAQPVASEPTVAGDFTGPVLTTSPNTPADAAPVALQAAYDAKNVYILGVWTDLTGDESLAKDQWEFDGTSWSRPAGRNEDRIALMFDINASDWGAGGCAAYCHFGETPGDGGRMRTNNAGETLDMWHWKAARSNPLGFADDKHVIWADGFNDTTTGTRKGDDGSSVDSNNRDGAGTLPAFMAESDPGANATHLIILPDGSARAVPFVP